MPLHKGPLPELPFVHQIVLPTPWDVGPVQIYLVEDEPLTLVDTGVKSSRSRRELEGALESLGVGLDEIRRVVLTHWHTDHMGQVQTMREHGADLELWVHEADAPYVEDFVGERERNIEATDALFREHGVPAALLNEQRAWRTRMLREEPLLCDSTRVDRLLRGGERIPFKRCEFEVRHAPGHTAGHVLLHEPRSGALLTGDHLMGNAVPFTDTFYTSASAEPGDPVGRRARFRGLSCYLDSLSGLRRERFTTLLPAHGGILERPARVIDEAALFYEVRVQRLERRLDQQLATAPSVCGWEIWQGLFPKADSVQAMRTRMLMVIGILDVLEEQGRVRVERDGDGVLRYARP